MIDTLRSNFRRRPFWMNVLMVFCAYMAVIYVPWDLLFKPVADDEEVWFGIMLTGWGAKLTEPLHLLIYAGGAWGFWHMRSWMHPWALLYTAQVAIGMFVWSMLNTEDAGLLAPLLGATPFVVLCVLFWRARTCFGDVATDESDAKADEPLEESLHE